MAKVKTTNIVLQICIIVSLCLLLYSIYKKNIIIEGKNHTERATLINTAPNMRPITKLLKQ